MFEDKNTPKSDLTTSQFGPAHIHSPAATANAALRFSRATQMIESAKVNMDLEGFMPNEAQVVYICEEAQEAVKHLLSVHCIKVSTPDAPILEISHFVNSLDGKAPGEGDRFQCFEDEPSFVRWCFDYQQFLESYVSIVRRKIAGGMSQDRAQANAFGEAILDIPKSERAYFSPADSEDWIACTQIADRLKPLASEEIFLAHLVDRIASGAIDSSTPHELNADTHRILAKDLLLLRADVLRGIFSRFDLGKALEVDHGSILLSDDLYKQMKELNRLELPEVRRALAFLVVQECGHDRIAAAKELGASRVDATIEKWREHRDKQSMLLESMENLHAPSLLLVGQARVVELAEYMLVVMSEYKGALERYYNS